MNVHITCAFTANTIKRTNYIVILGVWHKIPTKNNRVSHVSNPNPNIY